MFKVPEISQIAVVVKDLEKAMDNYWEILGWGPWQTYSHTPQNLKDMTIGGKDTPYGMNLALFDVGNLQFELIEPTSGPNIYFKQLETKGEGLHHFACYGPIKSPEILQRHQEELKAQGLSISMSGVIDEANFCYYDTESVLGGAIYETGYIGPVREPDMYDPADKGIEPPEFRVTEISQLAITVKDLDKTLENYSRILGWGPWDVYEQDTIRFALYDLDNTQFEVVQPISGEYRAQLEKVGEGFNHMSCYDPIKDQETLDRHLEELYAKGLKVHQSGPIYDVGSYYDFATEDVLNGVIYETGIIDKMPEPDRKYP